MNKNELYPIFLKVSELNILIVGGGKVGLEKLTFLLKSSPKAKVTVLAESFISGIIDLSQKHSIKIITNIYNNSVLENKHIVIAATNNLDINLQIHADCKKVNILVNVADNPDYCDFYLGGIVTKGNLKLAISTNGKSPTLAKRLRQFFEEILPDNINELAENLNEYRMSIRGEFQEKVEALNELTKDMIYKKE